MPNNILTPNNLDNPLEIKELIEAAIHSLDEIKAIEEEYLNKIKSDLQKTTSSEIIDIINDDQSSLNIEDWKNFISDQVLEVSCISNTLQLKLDRISKTLGDDLKQHDPTPSFIWHGTIHANSYRSRLATFFKKYLFS